MKRLSTFMSSLIFIVVVGGITVGAIRFFQGGKMVINSSAPPADWKKFTDPVAGYSFYYPPDSYLQSGINVNSKYTFNYLTLRNNKAVEIVQFYTLDNQEKVPLQKFIQTEKALMYAKPTDVWRTANLESYIDILEIRKHEALLVKQSEATFPLTEVCQQVTYIRHENRVIAIELCPARRGVWELGYKAAPEIENIYFQVLSTLEFFSPEETVQVN